MKWEFPVSRSAGAQTALPSRACTSLPILFFGPATSEPLVVFLGAPWRTHWPDGSRVRRFCGGLAACVPYPWSATTPASTGFELSLRPSRRPTGQTTLLPDYRGLGIALGRYESFPRAIFTWNEANVSPASFRQARAGVMSDRVVVKKCVAAYGAL